MSVGTKRLFSGKRASRCRLKEKLDTMLPNPHAWKLTLKEKHFLLSAHFRSNAKFPVSQMYRYVCRKHWSYSVMCISTHFVFPCSTYQCMSKGSSIQYYNFTCSVASEKLGFSARMKEGSVYSWFGCKGENMDISWSQ